jgi:hypothetical protein
MLSFVYSSIRSADAKPALPDQSWRVPELYLLTFPPWRQLRLDFGSSVTLILKAYPCVPLWCKRG